MLLLWVLRSQRVFKSGRTRKRECGRYESGGGARGEMASSSHGETKGSRGVEVCAKIESVVDGRENITTLFNEIRAPSVSVFLRRDEESDVIAS